MASAAASGYLILLLSNQGGVAGGKQSAETVQARAGAVAGRLCALGVPCTVILALGADDWYRKPRPGMWWLYEALIAPAMASCLQVTAGDTPHVDAAAHTADGAAASHVGAAASHPGAAALHGLPPLALDRSASFYCGDAAGRPKTPTRPKDHSDCDLAFALNLGLRFRR